MIYISSSSQEVSVTPGMRKEKYKTIRKKTKLKETAMRIKIHALMSHIVHASPIAQKCGYLPLSILLFHTK